MDKVCLFVCDAQFFWLPQTIIREISGNINVNIYNSNNNNDNENIVNNNFYFIR